MGKKVKSQNDKFSLEKEMKMIAIHLSCRHFIPINNPSTEKERWHERAAVRIFYIDFSSTLSWMEKLPKAWLNVCACFSLEIIKVPTSEKLAFNKMYQQHSQNEPNSILLRLSVGEETSSPVHDRSCYIMCNVTTTLSPWFPVHQFNLFLTSCFTCILKSSQAFLW